MLQDEWQDVAELIHHSTNSWYVANGKDPIFKGPPSDALIFCKVYEDLDPGCCLVARCKNSGKIAGSCFYHPRKTHMSLGIMNVSPDFFGQGIARSLVTKLFRWPMINPYPSDWFRVPKTLILFRFTPGRNFLRFRHFRICIWKFLKKVFIMRF